MVRDSGRGVVREHMPAGGFREAREQGLVGECDQDSLRQPARLHVIKQGMYSSRQRLVSLDGRAIDHGNGSAGRGLVVSEAIPAVSLGRPYDASAGAPAVKF